MKRILESFHNNHVDGRGRGRPNERPPGGLRWLSSVAVGTLLAAALAPLAMVPAQAAVAGVSPVDPQTGFPTWYSDGTVKLQLCYMTGSGCLSEPPNPGAPASYPDNFPDEAFWFQASAAGGTLLYEAALEAAHANGAVIPGDQQGFARLRFLMDGLVPGASYTFRHPYGVNTFTADPVGAKRPGEIKQTIDAGLCTPSPRVPCDWAGVGEAFLGDFTAGTTATFLRQVGAPAGTIGDINTARPVTGAPSGLNAVIVEGPDAGGPGVNTLRIDNFTVQGLIYDGPDAAPSTPDLAPASDSGRSSTDNITNVTTPTLTGTVPGVGAAEAAVELLVDGATTPAATTTTVGGAYSLPLDTALAPGAHRVQARTLNPAYTVDPATGLPVDPAVPQYLTSGTLTFTVDSAAPTTTVVAPFPSNPTLDNTPTLTYRSDDPAATHECQLLPSNSTWDPGCTSPKSYDAQLDGDYTFNVRATDAAGNVGTPATFSWRIGAPDTVLPTLTAQAPAANATGVPLLNTVTATFSEAVVGVNGSAFVLQDANGAVVPAAVTYDAGTRRATLDPTNPLADSNRYTVSLKNTITDPSGNAFAGSTWAFTTADTVVPTVSVRTPAAAATAVTVGTNVSATFSEAVQAVSGTTFTLRNGATAVAGAVTYDPATRVATLNPTADLAAGTTYTATLTGGATAIRDAANNALANTTWTFTTAAPADTTVPTVSTRTPAAAATVANQTGDISATFSEAVQAVSGTTFTLRTGTATGTPVAGAVTYNTLTRVATLNPTATLAADTRYTATLTGGATAIRDSAGNALATTSWTFTTGPAPTVTARSAAPNATGVSQTGNVTATFSEAVTGVSATTFTLRTGTATGTPVAGAVTYNTLTRVATLNPTATLAADTRYTATLTGGATAVRDSAGNALATTSWTFTTGPAPTVTARSAAPNATGVSQTGNVTATFSEAVTGVSATTFTLRTGTATGTPVAGAVTYNTLTRVATLNPTATLAADTRYTATLTGGATAVRDSAGNALATTSWTFTTGPAPTVTARSAAPNATAVSRTANVTATFSEAVTGTGTGTFTLRNATTNALIPAVVSYNTLTRVATLNPSATLAANTRFTAALTTGIRDTAGNSVPATTWSFTTGP